MVIKRVLLLMPEYHGTVFGTMVFLPVGLGYVAEALRTAGIQYRFLDLRIPIQKEILEKTIMEFRPELIGFSLVTANYKNHYSAIKTLKKAHPSIPILAGGPHLSTMKEKALIDCPELDFGVVGEGEEAIVELCSGNEPPTIRGLIYRDDKVPVFAGIRPFFKNIDSIQFPTFEGFNMEPYSIDSISVVSSRGCPYKCIYCCVKNVIGNKWRARSPENVVDEIEYWYLRGYRVFNFNDDCFNLDRNRVLNICDEVEKRRMIIELNAPNGIRADKVDTELLQRMKEVGFRLFSFGVEAGNNRVLSTIKKGETIEEIEDAVRMSCEMGFDVGLFFLIGSPGETEEDIECSFRLAEKYPVMDVRFYNLTPFPNTDLFQWVEKNDYFILNPDDYLNGNMHWSNLPAFATPDLPAEKRSSIYERGIRLGGKLRREYIYRYYIRGFSKLGLFSRPAAWLASRNSTQYMLKRSYLIQGLRYFMKRKGLFNSFTRR